MQAIMVAVLRLAQNAAKDPVLRLAQPPVAHLVFWLAQSVGRVVVDHAGLDCVGENPAKKTHCADRRSAPTADNGLATQFLGFHYHARLARDDVLHQVVHVRLCNVPDPARAEQGDNVPADAAHVDLDRRGLLGAAAFAHDQASLHVLDILLAELLDRQRPPVLLAFLGRVFASGDVPEQDFRLASCRLGRPDPVPTDRVAAASSPRAVLDDVAAFSGGIDAEPEAGHLVIPDRRALWPRLDRFDKSLRELRHAQTLLLRPISRKQDATTRPETKAYSRIELSAQRLAVSMIFQ